MNVTVDASVFVAQAKEGEPFNAASRECIVRLERPDWQRACLALVLPECAGALARTLDDQALTETLVELLRQFPGMKLVPLTTRLAPRARLRLRPNTNFAGRTRFTWQWRNSTRQS